MKPRRAAVIMHCGVKYTIDLVDVTAWIRGFLYALIACGNTQAAQVDMDTVRPKRGERLDQTCYRILCTCHDLGVIRYIGITSVEQP